MVPEGGKFFSFTFQAYDLDQELRDPFKTKRKVWLEPHHRHLGHDDVRRRRRTEAPYTLDVAAPTSPSTPSR